VNVPFFGLRQCIVGSHHFRRAASTRSIRVSMTGLLHKGNMLTGAQKATVSPNTVRRRTDRVTYGGDM